MTIRGFASLPLLGLSVLGLACHEVNPKPETIPALRQWRGGNDTLSLGLWTRIVLNRKQQRSLKPVAETFLDDLSQLVRYRPAIEVGGKLRTGDVVLEIDPKLGQVGDEGYKLTIGDQVVISAKTATGVFYGTRSLLQMIAIDPHQLRRGEAVDWPDYQERGFMLDVGRKFFDIKYLRQYVKFMAWFKMNDFQLHLNDNAADDYSGFRLISDKFPGLANKDGAYTRKEIEDLQDLAARYHVNITPEIDAPAHARAFTKYRPDLGNKNLPKDHLDLANLATQKFVNSIWKEFIPWFRSPWVHIGADEYNGGPGGPALYKRYINQTAAFVRSQGKKVRMWGGLKTAGGAEGVDRDIVVNLWYPGYHDPIDAVREGYNLINTQDGYLYIVPFAGYYYQYLDTRDLYDHWKPTAFGDEKLPDDDPHILGGMFAVWNDKASYPYTFEDVHELVKPAMPTLGEILWAGHPADAFSYDTFAKVASRLAGVPGVWIAPPTVKHEPGDLAFDMPATASENQSGDFGVQTLFDGRAPTRWIASAKKPQWAQVDLREPTQVGKVILKWVPHCNASTYRISISLDGVHWNSVYETAAGTGGTETATFTSIETRYVRLDCLKQGGSEANYSLFAFEVYK